MARCAVRAAFSRAIGATVAVCSTTRRFSEVEANPPAESRAWRSQRNVPTYASIYLWFMGRGCPPSHSTQVQSHGQPEAHKDFG